MPAWLGRDMSRVHRQEGNCSGMFERQELCKSGKSHLCCVFSDAGVQ